MKRASQVLDNILIRFRNIFIGEINGIKLLSNGKIYFLNFRSSNSNDTCTVTNEKSSSFES